MASPYLYYGLVAAIVALLVVPRLWALVPAIKVWWTPNEPPATDSASIHAKIDAVRLLRLPADLERQVYLFILGHAEEAT